MKNTLFFAMQQAGIKTSPYLNLFQELNDIEKILGSFAHSKISFVQEILDYTLQSGGKKLRPALFLLCAKIITPDYSKKRGHLIAACIEAIHMASLMHDDVIDQADLRRGILTSAKKFGANETILTGDVLLAKTMHILAQDGDLELMKIVSQTVIDLSEGEVYELQTRSDFYLSYPTYLKILELKTASLVKCACQLGAKVAGANQKQEKALANFGYHLGIAFQMTDDLLDYKGKTNITGKKQGADIKEGCMTLPLIILRDNASENTLKRLQKIFNTNTQENDWKWLLKELHTTHSLTQSENIVQKQVNLALEALETSLPYTQTKELVDLANMILNRQL